MIEKTVWAAGCVLALLLSSSPTLAQTAAESPEATPAPEAPAPAPGPPPAPPPPPSGMVPGPPVHVGGPDAPAAGDVREPDRVEEQDPGASLPAAENAAREPWLGVLGARALYITSEGYDPFDDNDELTQFSVGFGRSVYAAGRFAVAGLVFYDVGGTSSAARRQPTELMLHRVSLGLEARFHPLAELYGYGRIAPGLLNVSAELNETASGITLEDQSWVFGVDATVGLAYRFARTSGSTNVGFWLLAEGGYGVTTSAELSLEPGEDSDSAPERMAAVSLGQGALALSGATFRLLGGLSF